MNNRLGIVVTMFITFFLPPGLAEEPTGAEIIKEQEKRHKVQTEYAEEVMILLDSSGGKEKRLLKRYSKEMEGGNSRALMVFMAPADIKGTAVLTWDNEGRDNDQWLYLPAQKKMQRIAKGSKKNYFMGTDLTYEDMEPEDIDNFNYTVLRSEGIQHGRDCWVVEGVPANKAKRKESGYSKRLMWIDKENYLTLKSEFFDRRERLIKTQTGRDAVNIEGNVWRFKKGLVDNVSTEHKTVVGTKTRKMNEPIEDSVFTERFILSGKHAQ